MQQRWLRFSYALPATLVALAAGSIAFVRRFLPRTRGVIRIPNMPGTAEVIRDRWGIPHIYASSEEALFFAQGYVHAQDRLWQMELQRRAGAGRLAEILGEAALEMDRFFRVLGLHRAAEAEADALEGETKAVLEAYAAGVNAYMTQRRGRLALEFALLRYTPEPWQPVDSLYWAKVMCLNLGSNWASEVIRARLTARLGADLAADLEPSYPADNPAMVHGPDQADDNASPPNGWRSQALLQALQLVEALLPQADNAGRLTPSLPGLNLAPGASNQWVVSGARSASGRPLLANDTHMPVSLPPIWYLVHLVGGRYNVAGVSLPGAPAVVVGHNGRCAWGLTTAWQDAQDLYVERLNPDNPHQYEYQGQWHEAQVVHEVIRVRGRREPVVEEVVITRHGPIVSQLTGEATPMALRWVALEKSDLLGSVLAYNRARNWEEFRAALAQWAAPAHNFVYADVDDNIGFLQAGWVPVRRQGYGIAPVPGWSGDYEWERYLSLDELPQVFNPEQGWIAAANNLVVDERYPHFLSADLENPCRAARIAELLGSQETFTIDDFACFQRDTYSAQAERFLHHFARIQPTNQREADALTLLQEWDCRLEPDSVAATIYHLCRLRALHEAFDGPLGELADLYVGVASSALGEVSPYHGRSFVRLLDLLEQPAGSPWLKDPETGRERSVTELLHRSLRQALKLLRSELGPDMSRWDWGRLNRLLFAHVLGSIKPLNFLFNRGPYPMGGDHDTLLRASGKPAFPFEPVLVVDALRFVADLSDWDRCRFIIPGGQSGHVASRHYADLIPLWRQGRMITIAFSRDAVEGQARERVRLVPQQDVATTA